jgi:hypothetical protein
MIVLPKTAGLAAACYYSGQSVCLPKRQGIIRINLLEFLHMSTSSIFLYTGALLPDGRILVKANMRDAAKARDQFMVLSASDELYEEALTHAVSYVTLLEDGNMEVKVRVVEDDNPAGLESSSRTKIHLAPDSPLFQLLTKIAGPLQIGKQVWLDLPRNVK